MKFKLKQIVTAISLSALLGANNMAIAEKNDVLSSISISGVVQVESRFHQDYDDNDSSDFVVDEFALGIEAQADKFVKGQMGFLYEEGATDLEIDEAFITLGNFTEVPFYLAAGQLYVPFGRFESHMISDPLTLEIGEAREKAAQLGFEIEGLYGSVYIFNGMTQDDADDKIDHYGANLGFAQETEAFSYDVGVSYISDLADSDGLSGALEGVAPAGDLSQLADYDYVNGLGAHLLFNIGPVSVIGEYLTALDDFNAEHLAFKGKGAEPKAWNAELGYSFNIVGKETTFALGYQGTDEAVAIELPETRLLAGLSMGIYKNTTFSVEYAHDEDYDVSNGGSGEDAQSVIFQLAVEF
ncbi:MAG TPA: LbtU family siderophore porin [Thiotrichaceae bacterium]|nr:LbtU family siderophore porin [Thiotrichaceae bacterium]